MTDEDDRSRDGSSAADASWTAVVVPDDISSLAGDIAAYRREQRAVLRRERIQRLVGRRRAFPLALVTTALLLAAIVASMLTLLTRGTVDRQPQALPLASTKVAAGQVGGLIPLATLVPSDSTTSTVSSRAPALRPAVLALIGPNCNCADALDDLARAGGSVNFPLDIVVSASADPFSRSYSRNSHLGQPDIYFDRSGVLSSAIQAHGVTAVVVAANGLIYAIQRQVNQANIRTGLDQALEQATQPGTSAN